MTDLNKLISDAQVAIEFWEDIDAKKILKKLRIFIVENKIEQADPALFSKLQKWIVYLQLVAFPSLSDQECGEILRNHFLESFRINVPMENRITAKLFFFPYLARDEVREVLKRGLAGNIQNLGTQTIGQWIQEFEKQFNVHSRTESAPVQFFMQNPKASSLSPTEQHILKETLHIYDYLLVSTLPAIGEDLQNLIEAGVFEKESGSYGEQAFSRNYGSERLNPAYSQNSEKVFRDEKIQKKNVNISLLEALKQYPNLGEQVISSNPIKLRYFPTPVKPSIKNWITDYHDALGQGKHGTIDRGNFLFHSENGKKLTPDERQKVSNLLKSLDEGTPLEIDGDAQKVIFSIVSETQNIEKVSRPTAVENVSGEDVAQMRIKQSLNFAKNLPIQKENISKALEFEDSNYASALRERISANSQSSFGESKIERKMKEEKTQAGSLRFSSAQELPVEKNVSINQNKNLTPQTNQTFNSPDFKRHISQPATVQPGQIKTPRDVVVYPEQDQAPKTPQRVYSPYIIGPTNQYEKNSDDMDIFKKKNPRIQGNTVDLS